MYSERNHSEDENGSEDAPSSLDQGDVHGVLDDDPRRTWGLKRNVSWDAFPSSSPSEHRIEVNRKGWRRCEEMTFRLDSKIQAFTSVSI